MQNNIFGYIRVSTQEQNIDRQFLALKAFNIPKRNIYIDRQSGKDLFGMFTSDLVLQILSFVAQLEWDNIRQRQAEGIAAAKARGIIFGKKALPPPDNFNTLFLQWRKGEISAKETAALCGFSLRTLYNKTKELRNKIK
jgi:DNA invertase Pin-like site-specific DNA recombinase